MPTDNFPILVTVSSKKGFSKNLQMYFDYEQRENVQAILIIQVRSGVH